MHDLSYGANVEILPFPLTRASVLSGSLENALFGDCRFNFALGEFRGKKEALLLGGEVGEGVGRRTGQYVLLQELVAFGRNSRMNFWGWKLARGRHADRVLYCLLVQLGLRRRRVILVEKAVVGLLVESLFWSGWGRG